jgi:hypothetical protein
MYSAEVGRTAGGVVNIITKSGSNNFHGSAFEFNRNDKFDERGFFAPKDQPKPQLDQNQYGGSVGGPVKKNKTFFFADYEKFKQTQGVTFVSTVPTAKMRAGDFSEIAQTIYDPTSAVRTAFAGNVIPSGRLDPIALRYMALYPQPSSAGLANNFTFTNTRTQDSGTADFRVDHRFNDNNTLFARYSYNNVDTFTPGALPAVNGIEPGGNNGTFPGPNTTIAHGLQTNYLKIWGPSVVSELRFGYMYGDIESLPLNYGKNLGNEFGIKNANIDQVTSALTPMNPAGYQTLGDAQFIPLITVNKSIQISGSVTKNRGAHSLKAGAGVVSRRFRQFQSSSAVGVIPHDRAHRQRRRLGWQRIASFLLGYPATVARVHTLFDPHYRTAEPNFFVQDDWRATSWLTVNAGVRYDVFTPLTEQANNLSNIDLSTLKILVAGQNGVSDSGGVSTDYGNIAPRLGFSATLPNLMVVRGGYGLSYFPGNYMSQSLRKNPPFIGSFGPVTSNGASGGLPNLRLSDGLPLPTPTDAANPAGTIIGVAQDFKHTRIHQFNVVAEKDFSGNVISAGYVGSRGDNVAFVVPNLDLAPAAPGAIQARRRFFAQLPNVTTIGLFASDFESSYDALQLVFQRRHRNGLTIGSNYVLAHTTWTQPTPNDVGIIERFDADFDIRHKIVFSANYELPFGRVADRRVEGPAGWLAGERRRLLAERAAVQRHQLDGAVEHQRGNDRPDWSASRRATTRRSPSGSTSPRSRRRCRTPSAMRRATSCTGRRSGGSISRSSRTSRWRRRPSCRCGSRSTTSPTRRASPTRSRSWARPASGRSTASATRSRGRCSSRRSCCSRRLHDARPGMQSPPRTHSGGVLGGAGGLCVPGRRRATVRRRACLQRVAGVRRRARTDQVLEPDRDHPRQRRAARGGVDLRFA